jgi:predicted HicB family RNase H-like nuclease
MYEEMAGEPWGEVMFLALSGGADFYAASVETLAEEGRKSLRVYVDLCREKSVEPFRAFSGKFNERLDPKADEKP